VTTEHRLNIYADLDGRVCSAFIGEDKIQLTRKIQDIMNLSIVSGMVRTDWQTIISCYAMVGGDGEFIRFDSWVL
jgi:hypothetical protein